MTIEIERWLGPMISALLVSRQGAEAFVGLMGSVVNWARDDVAEDGRDSNGIDWVRFGQMIRAELYWVDYPTHPPRIMR